MDLANLRKADKSILFQIVLNHKKADSTVASNESYCWIHL
jgi:hypothetical protein